MVNTLLIAKDMMAAAAAAGRSSLDADQVSFIRSAYAGALSSGREANAANPKSKAAKPVNRFTRDAADILRFTTDTAIWFTNNQSERDLRPTKLQQKISATWRSLQGLADFATLRSYLSTAGKHGQDLLDVLTALFTTGPGYARACAPAYDLGGPRSRVVAALDLVVRAVPLVGPAVPRAFVGDAQFQCRGVARRRAGPVHGCRPVGNRPGSPKRGSAGRASRAERCSRTLKAPRTVRGRQIASAGQDRSLR